jgi:hypothetical protein
VQLDELCYHYDGRGERRGHETGTCIQNRAHCLSLIAATTKCPIVNVAGAWSQFDATTKRPAVYETLRASACKQVVGDIVGAIDNHDERGIDAELANAAIFCTSDPDLAQMASLRTQVEKLHEYKRQESEKLNAVDRCGGGTTMAFVMRVTVGGRDVPKDVSGCRYTLFGKVVSSNKEFIQLTNITSGDYAHLIRTSETFVDGTVFSADRVRYATYEGLQRVTLHDGSSHAFHVFRLLP